MADQEMLQGTNRDAVRVALTGAVRTAPVGTAIVGTDEKYNSEVHKQEGYLSSDGVEVSFDENRQDFIPWQEASAIRTDIIEATTGIQYTMWETGPGKLAEYLGVPQSEIQEMEHGGVGFFTGGLPEFDSVQTIVDMFDKGKHQRTTFLNTQIAERGGITMNKEGVYGLQITRNVYPAGNEYQETAPDAIGNTAWWEFNKNWKDASEISTGSDGSAPVSIGSAAVPGATVGESYSHGFTVAGGASPYTWSVSAGDLPAGLSLSSTGTVSGTPTEGGDANFTVRVQDRNGLYASRQVTLTVADAEGE
ncbi:Ig domain-containing protein [Corynebacterium sp. AOP40-9SA-29]|uniref:Ig domain-containing protein n=1 Tax=Corynebacterium sp. AOP40-9SA-29 TaxID=3457677 RepID=UPI0040333303